MAGQIQKPTFRVLGIKDCSVEALKPRFLRRLWYMLGAAPPENQFATTDDDTLYISTPPTGMSMMVDTGPPHGFIALWVDDLDAAVANLIHRGFSVYNGTPVAGISCSGFNISKSALDADVDVRIDQIPAELKKYFV